MISIITVAFNSEKTILDTLASVRMQVNQEYEHIIIDGGSTDNTVDIVNKFNSTKIHLISELDTGIYNAMNKGLKIAKGDIIGFLNSDDYYYDSNVLSRISEVFYSPGVQICYGDLIYASHTDGRIVRFWKSTEYKDYLFGCGWAPAHPTFYVRKEVLKIVGYFDEGFKLAGDTDFMIRALYVNKLHFKYIPQIFVKMRTGGATGAGLKSLIKQNSEIYCSLRKNNIKFNPIIFFIGKLYLKLVEHLRVIWLIKR